MFFGGRFRILNGVFGIPLGVGLGVSVSPIVVVDSEVTGEVGVTEEVVDTIASSTGCSTFIALIISSAYSRSSGI